MKDHKENLSEEVAGTEESTEFSTASLPSRKEIHGKKKQKTKWKMKFPFVKLLALFFVILLGTVWAIASSITKDGESVASSKDKESGYTETIGEISGFDDDGEDDVADDADENEEPSNEEEDEQSKEEEPDADEQSEQESEKVTSEPETEVATAESTVENQQDTQNTQQTTTASQSKDEVIQHVVKSNENLFRIALKYYSSAEGVEIIKQYNGMKSNDIRVGQVLKIPPR